MVPTQHTKDRSGPKWTQEARLYYDRIIILTETVSEDDVPSSIDVQIILRRTSCINVISNGRVLNIVDEYLHPRMYIGSSGIMVTYLK